MGDRWLPEYVLALAPDPASAAAARRLALPASWVDSGCDEHAVWGRYRGSGAEPYEVAVELEEAACRCTCLSRKVPCKHAVALLLLWSAGGVLDDVARPPGVARWLARRARSAGGATTATLSSAPATAERQTAGPGTAAPSGDPGLVPGRAALGDGSPGSEVVSGNGAAAGAAADTELREEAEKGADTEASGGAVASEVPPEPVDDVTTEHDSSIDPGSRSDPELSRRAAERAARVAAGLADLDRWMADCVRTGLADAHLDRPDAWERVATRLVDAQAGSLANRVRRLGARLARAPDHHEVVLAELGLLHLLASGGRRAHRLPGPLADSVRGAVGWTVRQDEVRSGPALTDEWLVAGRSDVQEDRIVVRRTWLQGRGSGRWAMVLSFAAYGQALEASLPVGATLSADVHFYPAARPLRALLGIVHDGPRRVGFGAPPALAAGSVDGACDAIGAALAAEPWLERLPVALRAAPAVHYGRWALADGCGSLPIAPEAIDGPGLMTLVACSGGRTLRLVAEWTPAGVIPLAAHLDDRVVDVGPHGPWGYG